MSSIKERLNILIQGNVVTKEAALVAEEAVSRLMNMTEKKLSQNKIEMLVTHLATALTRIRSGEELEAPPQALVEEVESSVHMENASKELDWIEHTWGSELPAEERSFLSIHYVSIFQEISEGVFE